MSVMNPIAIAGVLTCFIIYVDFIRGSKKRQHENEKAAFLNHTESVPVEINPTPLPAPSAKEPREVIEDSFHPTMFWVGIIGGSFACVGLIVWLVVTDAHFC